MATRSCVSCESCVHEPRPVRGIDGHAISVHDGPAHVQRLADLLDSYKS